MRYMIAITINLTSNAYPTGVLPHPSFPSPLFGSQGGFIPSEKNSNQVSKPLSALGRGLERGQNLWFKTRNRGFHIFLFSYETTLLALRMLGVGNLSTSLC
jgi:hypothetical protein